LPQHLQNMLTDRGMRYLALPSPYTSMDADELPHARWLQTSQAHDADQTLAAMGEGTWDWLVVDHYALDHRFETPLRAACQYIMVIDDLADRTHDCDVLLDHNFYHDQNQRYLCKVPPTCQLLLGPKFALLRSEFREMRKTIPVRSDSVRNILVFFGGVDSQNFTSLALQVLIDLNFTATVDVVIGKQHPDKENIQQLCAEQNFTCHVQTHHIASLMAKADLAMGAGGTAVWERFCMGLPSVCIATADNQRQQLTDLQDAGLLIATTDRADSKDFLKQTIAKLMKNGSYLQGLSQRGSALVDGTGVCQVLAVLKAQLLHIRLATIHDSPHIFNWRNHPQIRSISSNAQAIGWSDHTQWFDKRLSSEHGPLLIGEIRGQAIGVVRFDIHESSAEVSIYLVPDSGLKGWGSLLLSHAESWLQRHFPQVVTLHAKVLPDNEPSKKMFAKLNYVAIETHTPLEYVKAVETCT
jgi:UDP-2,4-diacetamido-2,4,6-trideoxy-beta-L-altropyranose hydrolase